MKLFGRKKYDNLVESLAKREDDSSEQSESLAAESAVTSDSTEKTVTATKSKVASIAKEADSVASLSGSFAMLGGAEIVFGGDPRSDQSELTKETEKDDINEPDTKEHARKPESGTSAETIAASLVSTSERKESATVKADSIKENKIEKSSEAEIGVGMSADDNLTSISEPESEAKDDSKQSEQSKDDGILAEVRKAAGLAPSTEQNRSSKSEDDKQKEDAMTEAEKTVTKTVSETAPQKEEESMKQQEADEVKKEQETNVPDTETEDVNDQSIDASEVDFSALEADSVEHEVPTTPKAVTTNDVQEKAVDAEAKVEPQLAETGTDHQVNKTTPAEDQVTTGEVKEATSGQEDDTASLSKIESAPSTAEAPVPTDPDRELTEPVAPGDTENEDQPVSVQQSQTLVNATISQQYNNVLSQNSLLLSQIERLQGINDKLNKQISRWQEYRNEATEYINNITIKSQDQVLKLKKDQKKELDEVNEAWLQKFDERSAEVDHKYQEFEKRIQGIITTESQEKADLQDQISKLQKDNMALDSEVTSRGFKINELSATVDELKQNNEDLEAAKRELTDELSKAVNDLNMTSERAQSATNEVAVLKKENADWKDNLAQAKVESLNTFNKSESRMGATIADLTEKLAKSESDKQQSQNKYSASLQRQRELESTVSDLNKQNKTLLDQISEMEAGDTKDYMSVPTFENDFPQM